MDIKVAVCDDEETELQYLASLVRRWAEREKHLVEISVFPSAEAFLFQYEGQKDYDILLLDIEMGAINGVELAKRIRKDNDTVQILFITGYADFISEGYEVSALHYLLKPVEEKKVCSVLDRAAGNLKKTQRCGIFQVDGETVRIPFGEIVCVEAFAHTVELRTFSGNYRLGESISELEELLGDGFVRCHRSYLVSIKYIKKISKTEILLDTDEAIPLSRRRYDMVNQAFIRYFKGE